MEKVNFDELTVSELIEMGANVNIYFYRNGNLQKAYDKLKPFTKYGSIKRKYGDKVTWVEIENESVEIVAFYRGNENGSSSNH